MIYKPKNSKEANKKLNETPKSTKKLKLVSKKQRTGAIFEAEALLFLQQQGLTLLHKNWLQAKVGEIDLIMLERITLKTGRTWDTLVFVEVRVRKIGQYGDAISSITKAKQRKIIKTAQYFLQQNSQYSNHDCRFDVVAYNTQQTKSQPSLSNNLVSNNTVSNSPISNNLVPNNLASNQSVQCSELAELNIRAEWITGAFETRAW